MTQVELANRLVNDCEELLTSRLGELNASSRLHVYHRLIRSHVEGLEDIADECFASIQEVEGPGEGTPYVCVCWVHY